MKNAKSRADMYALYAKARKDLSSKGTGKAFDKPISSVIKDIKFDNNVILNEAGDYVGGSDEIFKAGSEVHNKITAQINAANDAYESYLGSAESTDYNAQLRAKTAARKAAQEMKKIFTNPRGSGSDIKKENLEKGKVYRIGPPTAPYLGKWTGNGWARVS